MFSVLIYHSGIEGLSGGFLGVDVFFVISGYLITTNILTQQRLKSFTLRGFYKKRLLRILPVLLFVLIVTSIFAWQYLLPADLIEYSLSLLATVGFGSNFWFYFQDNYHAAESAAKPLLHTWSLGIEEQFYLFFPVLLIVMHRFELNRKFLILLLISVASLVLANFLSMRAAQASFYLLPTRVWELLIGSLLAIALLVKQFEDDIRLSTILSMFGFGLITSSIFWLDVSYLHPSFISLIPVLGVVLLILYADKAVLISSLLSSRFITYLGRLSYSIYLWHFPVFAFTYVKRLGEPLPLSKSLELIFLVLLLSVFSYHFIEKPCRYYKKIESWVLSFIAISVIGLSCFAFSVLLNDGYKSRLGDLESVFEGADRGDSFLTKDGKQCVFNVSDLSSCSFVDFPDGTSLINMGDSHANSLSVPLYEFAQSSGMNFYNMILSHCPYIIDVWRTTGFNAKCEVAQMSAVRDYLKSIKPSTIVYTVRFPYYLNAERFDNQEGGVERSQFLPFLPSNEAASRGDRVSSLIVKTLDEMGELGHRVILVYPIPEVGWHVPELIKSKLDGVPDYPVGRKKLEYEKISITTSYQVFKERTAYTKSILDRVSHENVVRVHPEALFCDAESGRCVTHNKETIFYYDDDHLSQSGASLLVEEIAKQINK